MQSPDNDTYALQRFVDAQSYVYEQVLAELKAGEKRSHWMWFIFPQILGLGRSPMAQRFAISSVDEARAYLAHPVLAARLEQCTRLVNRIEGRSLEQIFHSPDDMKFRSSMTLFDNAAPGNDIFRDALQKYCAGERDPQTLRLLEANG
ncbi:MAG: DUF1810 domain-containing protein [Steroidobacteraceae bacterium]